MFKELIIESIYQTDSSSRYSHIINQFKNRYGVDPDFITRAPGRVNLIGQHIDYEGYGVLPFAIQKDCVIAVALDQTNTIKIKHINNEQYPDHTISADVRQTPKYINVYIRYFYAGYQAALRQIQQFKNIPQQILQRVKNNQFSGMKILVQGNVPTGSGLSSSSSFCVCSALATLRANGLDKLLSKQQFISRVIKYERLVGTAIGGMDQSSSVLGQTNSALFIQFNPIRSTLVTLPDNYKFVIINSLQESKKIQTVGQRYNKRVCQCYMAVRLLSLKLQIKQQNLLTIKTFRDLQQYCKLPLQDMILLVKHYLEPKEYSRKELQQIFGSLNEFLKQIPNHEAVLEIDQTYQLYNAAIHVYSEAYRVIQFVNVCNSNLNNNAKGAILGGLMNQSQQSCKNTYKCSSKLLDIVTDLAIKQGAVGSRLTGAGWGGCSVSMVQQSKVKQFINTIKTKYFGREQLRQKVQKYGIDNLIFQTKPAEGACFVYFKTN